MADRFIQFSAASDAVPIEDRGFFDRVSDQVLTSAAVKTAAGLMRESETIFPTDPNYRWEENIPSGMENYYQQYATTRSNKEALALTHQIKFLNDTADRQSRDTPLQALGAGLVAQLADPLTYVPVPGLYGIGLVKGFGKGALTIGGLTAAGDYVGESFNPIATEESTRMLLASDVAFGAIFGAAFGGIVPRIVGPVASKLGFDKLGMKEGSLGENYMKAHSALDFGVAERISLDNLPYTVSDHAGAKVQIIRAAPGRTDTLPAGVRQVVPDITDPVFHGTPYHEKFQQFVDAEGNLVLLPSVNFDVQTGVSFGKTRDVAARYAGGDVNLRAYNPNIGMIFEIDRSALPNNIIDFSEEELFAPADPAVRDNIAELGGGVAEATTDELRPYATIIPAGKWRVAPATETSPFVAPTEYVGLRPEETVTIPAQEGIINMNGAELVMDYQNQPKGMFNSLNEWMNYNLNKALNEQAIPRIDGESDIAFADRIAKMSLDETRAGRVPLNPGGTFLDRMTLLGTMHASAADLFGNDNVMMNAWQQTIGDMTTNSVATQLGRPAVDSVFLRSERMKLQANLASSQSIHAAYASYMAGTEIAVNKYRNIITNFVANSWFIGNSKRNGKVDMPTFSSMVSVIAENPSNTHFNGIEIPKEVHIAAREHRKIWDYFEEKIKQYGMSDGARIVNEDIASLNRRISAVEDAIRRSPKRNVPSFEATLSGLQEELRVANLTKDNLRQTPLLPRGVDNYVNHVWRLDAVEARREEFTKKITELFARDQFEGAEDRAKRWVANLLGETSEDVLSPGGSAGGVMYISHRQINATFEEFGDFLETDVRLLMQHYTNKMVPAIEMHRMFGDRTMKRKIDELRTHLEIQYADLPEKQRLKKIGDQIQLMEDARDRVLGTFGVSDASQWSLRGVRALKNTTTLNHMGSTVVAAATDPMKILMRAGIGNGLKYALAHFDAGSEGLAMSKGMAKLAGQAAEFANWSTAARFQHGDSLIRANGTLVERGLDRAVPIFFQINGLTPWTIWMKEFTGGLMTHVLLADMEKIAKATATGKPLDQKAMKRLLAAGINQRDAVIISKMPIEVYGPHKMKLANVQAWTGTEGQYAREKFLAALQSEIQSSVMTASPGDKARIFDGVIYKSKARYKVEKQISDLAKQRDEVLEKIRAIRSGEFVPDMPEKPMVLGEPGTFQDLYAANRDKPIMPFKEAIPTGRQPLVLGEPGTFQDLYKANRDKPIMPFKEGIPVGRQPLTLGTPGSFQDFYKANANRPIRPFKEAIPVQISAAERNLPDPALEQVGPNGYTKDEMIAPLLEQLSEIGRQSGMLKNSAARVGRGGSPILGLPFQFMSFAVAAGPKLLGSMLNDRDRSRAMGALLMLSTGYLISRFWDNSSGKWDEMDADQKFYKAFDRSGLGGIITTMGATADTFDIGLEALAGWEDPYGPAKFSEKVGRIAGAGPGDVISFGQAVLDPDLTAHERASMIRRVTPGNNLFYMKGLFRSVSNALADYAEEDGTGISPAQIRGGSEPRPRKFE